MQKTASKKYSKLIDETAFLKTNWNLSDDAIAERSYDQNKLLEAAMVRESNHPQFDGMSYMKYNETNEMADISFLAPKINKYDSRITSGVTHEKDSSLLSFYSNLNFEGTVRVTYKDKELYDVGVALTNLARSSRENENYDDKRPNNYRSYIVQGTVLTIEEYVERYYPNKVITSEIDFSQLDKVTWVEDGKKKEYQGCESTMIDGKKVFYENIRERDVQKQPGLHIIEYIPREDLETIWGETERWKSVPLNFTDVQQSYTQGSIYSDWIYSPIDLEKMCVHRVYRPFTQRFQIYLNTVPMLPTGFPLKAVSPSGLIPAAKGDSDSMNMFTYSKSEPAKAKIDQAVFDKVLQNMLIKFKQSAMVPRGNLTDKIYDSSILMGGRFISDLNPKDIPPLIENPGITNSDFSFYSLIKEQIDTKTVSSLIEGNEGQGAMTLGQYMDMQKKQMLKLGTKIDGIINWERQMLRLRVANLIVHGAEKTGKVIDGNKGKKNEYRDVAVEAELSSGGKGLNILRFDDENTRTSEDVFNEQNEYEEKNGVEVDITYLNPKMIKDLQTDPDYKIYYDVVPVDKHNDKLAQIMFVKMITDAANIFGMDSLKVARLKKRYAAKFNEQFDDLFLNERELELKRMEMQQSAMEAEGEAGGIPESKEDAGLKDVMLQA